MVPTQNFDNIYFAMLTIFKVLTCDNWNDDMDASINATKQHAASLFFIAVIVMGSYIVLNLFLAILLENFGTPDDDEDEEGELEDGTAGTPK